MILPIVMIAIIAIIGSSSAYVSALSEEWNAFKMAHTKEYFSPEEELFRFKVYMENKALIANHNRLAHEGHHTYFLKMNRFGDLLPSEISGMNGPIFTDLKRPKDIGATFIAPDGFEAPTAMDWKTRGMVARWL